jgi:hypothetical protein
MNARYLGQHLRDVWQGMVNSDGRKGLFKFLLNVRRVYIVFESIIPLQYNGYSDVLHVSTLRMLAVFPICVLCMIPRSERVVSRVALSTFIRKMTATNIGRDGFPQHF